MTKSTEAHKAENRPVRKPLCRRRALEANGRPGFKRRWVNEEIGAIEAYQEAGYTLVLEQDVDLSENLAQDANLSGSVTRRVVNKDPNASTKTAVLMEIPEEFYKEDQAEKQRKLDEEEKSWNPNNKKDPSFYGDLKTTKSAVFNRGEDK